MLTVDVSSKVDFADIIIAQHGGVSCIRGVVGSTVVDGAACGEGQAGPQSIFIDEFPGAVLQLLTAKAIESGNRGTITDKNNKTAVRTDGAPGNSSQSFQHQSSKRLTRCQSWSSPV